MDATDKPIADAQPIAGSGNLEPLGALAVLAASASALAAAPLLMPDSYSWVSNTTSESAAQGVDGAWLARLGFLLLGFGALWVTRLAGRRWGLAASICFIAFGFTMTTVAAFATRPWVAGMPYNETEDLLHTIGATAVGFAFALGVASVIFQRGLTTPPRPFEAFALAATVVLPLGMSLFPGIAGVLQRLMFLVAYIWFAAAAISVLRSAPPEPLPGTS